MVHFEVAMIVVIAIFLLFLVVIFFLPTFGFFFVSEVSIYCFFLETFVGYFLCFWFQKVLMNNLRLLFVLDYCLSCRG